MKRNGAFLAFCWHHMPQIKTTQEDIWLKGKNFLRRHFFENKTFAQVKDSFFNFLDGQIFDFPKLSLFAS